MNVRSASLRLFSASVVASAVLYAGTTLFARELGAAAMGVFFLFQAALGIGKVPVDLGVQDATAKRISEGEPAGEVLASAVALKALPLAVGVAVVLAFRSHVNAYVGEPIAWLLALCLVIQQAAGLALKVLQGELRVGETGTVRLARDVVWACAGAVFVFGLGLGVYGLVYGLLLGYGVTLVWAVHRWSISFGTPSVRSVRSLVDYSKYNAITAAGMNLYGWLDVAIIGFFLTQSFVGAYEIAWRVAGLTIVLGKAVSVSLFPKVSSLDAEGSTDAIETVVSDALTPALLLIVPSFVGVLLFARPILASLFGQEYAVASLALVVLVAQKGVVAVRRIFYRTLKAIDRPNLAARATLVGIGTNVALNVALVPTHGLIGAALATTIACGIDTVLHRRYLARFIAIRFPVRQIGWCVVAALLMGVVLLVVEATITVETFPELVGSIVLGASVYLGVVLGSPTLRTALLGSEDVFGRRGSA